MAARPQQHIPLPPSVSRRRRVYPAHAQLAFAASAEAGRLYLVHDGWVMRSKLLPDGRRQITNYYLPGDFLNVGCGSSVGDTFGLCTLTQCSVSELMREDLAQSAPRIHAALVEQIARDGTALLEHLVTLGRRTATERLAWFILQVCARLEAAGEGRTGRFRLPLTQALIADTLGLSAVHVSRTMRALESAGVLQFEYGKGVEVIIHDHDRLRDCACM